MQRSGFAAPAYQYSNEDRIPRNLIDVCSRRGREMCDELASLLDKEYFWGEEHTTGEWWLLHHAVMILGLMNDERAGEILMRYMCRIDKAGDDTLEEWLSGYWPALFPNKPESVSAGREEIARTYLAGGEKHQWERIHDPWAFYTPEKIIACLSPS